MPARRNSSSGGRHTGGPAYTCPSYKSATATMMGFSYLRQARGPEGLSHVANNYTVFTFGDCVKSGEVQTDLDDGAAVTLLVGIGCYPSNLEVFSRSARRTVTNPIRSCTRWGQWLTSRKSQSLLVKVKVVMYFATLESCKWPDHSHRSAHFDFGMHLRPFNKS